MTEALLISHVADCNRRYPGEPLTFFTRVEARAALPGLVVQIDVPTGITLSGQSASASHGDLAPEFAQTDDARYLIWRVARAVMAGERFEYTLTGCVSAAPEDVELESRALAVAELDETRVSASETASVWVAARSRSLRYLPALYQEEDEMMGRFLMLFDSFWEPIEDRINQMPYYFDPRTIPSALLPWMASWVSLALDERWPEDKRRRLVRAAVALYRARGTKRGLLDYLEIYTGQRARIVEHGAHNFRLGPTAHLGPTIALGTTNQPHTFTVTLQLPRVTAATEAETARREQERRRIIENIIAAEKPAHTAFNLILETAE